MDNKAETLLKSLRPYFTDRKKSDPWLALDNDVLHPILSDACTAEIGVNDLDAWVMQDGSYITRIEETYSVGNDIDIFLENREKPNNLEVFK